MTQNLRRQPEDTLRQLRMLGYGEHVYPDVRTRTLRRNLHAPTMTGYIFWLVVVVLGAVFILWPQ